MSDLSRFTIVALDGDVWLWCLDCESIVQTVEGRLLPDIAQWADAHNATKHPERRHDS